MRYTLIILTLLTILVSCATEDKKPSNSFKVILPDTSKTHKVYTTFEHLKHLDEEMGLDNIYNGVDGFEIRIWIVSMIKPNRVFIIKKSNQGTTSQSFSYEYSSENKLTFNAGKTIQDDSYLALMDSLKSYDFENLLSQDEIESFTDNVVDGVTYTMEIATSKYYKLLTYHCPERFAKTEINNKKFLDLILLIDKYIHFWLPICSS